MLNLDILGMFICLKLKVKPNEQKISSQYMKRNVNLECLNLEFSSQYINFNYLNNSQFS